MIAEGAGHDAVDSSGVTNIPRRVQSTIAAKDRDIFHKMMNEASGSPLIAIDLIQARW